MWYHNPNPTEGDYVTVSAYYLKSIYFDPVGNFNYVIVGLPRYYSDAIDRYNTFINEEETFYGGPAIYNPLTFDFSQN